MTYYKHFYTCTRCGTERQYGYDSIPPAEARQRAVITCEGRCGQAHPRSCFSQQSHRPRTIGTGHAPHVYTRSKAIEKIHLGPRGKATAATA